MEELNSNNDNDNDRTIREELVRNPSKENDSLDRDFDCLDRFRNCFNAFVVLFSINKKYE